MPLWKRKSTFFWRSLFTAGWSGLQCGCPVYHRYQHCRRGRAILPAKRRQSSWRARHRCNFVFLVSDEVNAIADFSSLNVTIEKVRLFNADNSSEWWNLFRK